MLTAADIQFEPNARKHTDVTNSIVMMFSGDAGFHREIEMRTKLDVWAGVDANPTEWFRVRDVVDLYVKHRNDLKARNAEAAILAPMGLTQDSFLRYQATMQPDLVQQIARDLIAFQVPTTSCIIAGVDATGPHIYTVNNGYVTYHNATAFAAIGIGHWHAESEMMTGGHTARATVPEAVALVHRAKRRAEIAPGVGSKTDMFMINGRGGFNTFRDGIAEKLDELYENLAKQEIEARKGIHAELDAYVASLRPESIPEQENAPDVPASEPPTATSKKGGSKPASGASGKT